MAKAIVPIVPIVPGGLIGFAVRRTGHEPAENKRAENGRHLRKGK